MPPSPTQFTERRPAGALLTRLLVVVGAVVVILALLRALGLFSVSSFFAEAPRGSSAPAGTSGAGTAPASPDARPTVTAPESAPPPSGGGRSAAGVAPAPANSSPAEAWRGLTRFDFAALPIKEMPPDDGYVSPIASDDQSPEGSAAELLAKTQKALTAWRPGRAADPVQRVRNFLLLLGVADLAQSPIERFLPAVVVGRLLEEIPAAELAQLTCWIALHSEEGDVSALADPLLVELGAKGVDPDEARHRTHIYGVKLTRRLIGW